MDRDYSGEFASKLAVEAEDSFLENDKFYQVSHAIFKTTDDPECPEINHLGNLNAHLSAAKKAGWEVLTSFQQALGKVVFVLHRTA